MSDTADVQRQAGALHEKYLAERNKRILSEGVDQYVALEHPFQGDADPFARDLVTRQAVTRDVDVVIIGGGFSGLLSASSLIDEGITDICVIEKGADFGGTWYWNRYPGCRCDVEAYTYLPLIEKYGEMPTERYSRASDILAHSRRIAQHLGLYETSLLQTGVTGAEWHESAARWVVTTDRGDTIRGRFLCMASGILSRPKLPGIPGVETYKGHAFHSSRWDYAYTGGHEKGELAGLKDKRVAIIGTGASAVQAIPYLGACAKQLYVVQRTPAAVDPRENSETDPAWWNSLEPGWWEKRATNFEGFVIGLPQEEDLIQDGWTRSWTRMAEAARSPQATTPDDAARLRQLADYEKMEGMRERISSIVRNPATAESLKPYFNWMCKRPLFVDGYFETYNRPNVTLIDTVGRGLDRITENAIVFDDQSYEVDCIIYASGFEVAAPPDRTAGFEMKGAGGVTLGSHWENGRTSLHGMWVHNFPNMGIISGLKQAGITWSITFMNRRQSEHFAAVVRRCLDEGLDRVEPTEQAERDWLAVLGSKAVKDDTYLRECTPGYYNNEGKNLRDSIWLSNYGGGPFEYMDLLREWLSSGGMGRDFELRQKEAALPSR